MCDCSFFLLSVMNLSVLLAALKTVATRLIFLIRC